VVHDVVHSTRINAIQIIRLLMAGFI
jgi:hypothetical protein